MFVWTVSCSKYFCVLHQLTHTCYNWLDFTTIKRVVSPLVYHMMLPRSTPSWSQSWSHWSQSWNKHASTQSNCFQKFARRRGTGNTVLAVGPCHQNHNFQVCHFPFRHFQSSIFCTVIGIYRHSTFALVLDNSHNVGCEQLVHENASSWHTYGYSYEHIMYALSKYYCVLCCFMCRLSSTN